MPNMTNYLTISCHLDEATSGSFCSNCMLLRELIILYSASKTSGVALKIKSLDISKASYPCCPTNWEYLSVCKTLLFMISSVSSYPCRFITFKRFSNSDGSIEAFVNDEENLTPSIYVS